jgi:GT2 family glycosyltransferase
MDLSIIFVNWNAVCYLRECIAGIYARTQTVSFEIIVVDNASPDADVDELGCAFPEIRIVKSPENLGFARANNLGFTKAVGDYVLLLNPDTELVGPAIDTMMARIKTLPDAGIVGCRHVSPDLTVQTTSIQTFPTILNQMLNIEFLRVRWPDCPLWRLGPLFADLKHPVVVQVIPGACMLLRRRVFEQAGMFSEEYFMYGEDIDLNYKVARFGLRNYYIPDAIIVHYGGRSSSRQRVREWPTIMKYRAMGQLYRKNRSFVYAKLYQAAMGACALVRLALLVVAFTFADRAAVQAAFAKWRIILKWACGMRAGLTTTAR